MSMMPAFRAVLQQGLTLQETQNAVANIKKIKGVVGASAQNGKSLTEVWVTYTGDEKVIDEVKKVQGVASISPKPLL